MSTRKLQAIVLVFLVLVVASVAAASRRYETSEYCGSCHTPYLESWEQSNHAQVECVECHTGPGVGGWIQGKIDLNRMIRVQKSGGTSEPGLEVGPDFCLRCHPKASNINETETVKIPHAIHESVGLDCASCHGGEIHGENGGPSTTISHDTCYGCHAEEIDSEDLCEKCHKW